MMQEYSDERQRFDKWAGNYDRGWLDYLVFGRVHDKMINEMGFVKNKKVLDVGCGTGSLLLRLAHENADSYFIGLDYSEEMIKKAKSKSAGLGNIEFIVGDSAHLPFRNDSFDYVLSSFSFHHWPRQEESLRDIHSLLKDNGKFMLADLNYPVLAGKSGIRVRKAEETLKILREAGFQHIIQTSPTNFGTTEGIAGLVTGVPLSAYGFVVDNPIGYLGIGLLAVGTLLASPNLISKLSIAEK